MGWVKAGGSKQMVANSLLCHAPHVSDQFAPLSSQRYIPNSTLHTRGARQFRTVTLAVIARSRPPLSSHGTEIEPALVAPFSAAHGRQSRAKSHVHILAHSALMSSGTWYITRRTTWYCTDRCGGSKVLMLADSYSLALYIPYSNADESMVDSTYKSESVVARCNSGILK